MVYNSVFSDWFSQYIAEKSNVCSGGYIKRTAAALESFDMYCAKTGYALEFLTEGIVNGWLAGQPRKDACARDFRRTAIRQFAMFLLNNGIMAYVPPVCNPNANRKEPKRFSGSLSGFIEGLIESKRSRGYKYGPFNEKSILMRLGEFCNREGLETDALPKRIVEKWSERTAGEGAKSRSNRITVIRQLALHMAALGGSAYIAEAAPVPITPSHIYLMKVKWQHCWRKSTRKKTRRHGRA